MGGRGREKRGGGLGRQGEGNGKHTRRREGGIEKGRAADPKVRNRESKQGGRDGGREGKRERGRKDGEGN